MNATDLQGILELARRKTTELLDAIARHPEPARVLAYRPGPGRAHIAWQLLHIAATDDRHLNVRMQGGEPKEPDLIRRFGVGSVPDDAPPSLDQIRRYLTDRRADLLNFLRTLPESELARR